MISISQSYTAIAANITSSFYATGGTAPYVYSVDAGGAGGSIDSSTGVYTAPSVASSSPYQAYDTIRVTDALSATATAKILVGTPAILFCDIIQKGLGLADGRVYLWDQKIMQPTDYDLYVAVSIPFCRPFGNTNTVIRGSGLTQVQSVNMLAQMDVDIISRGPAARDRKEEVILALNSVYAEQQMEANSFFVAKLPVNSRFINLSQVDGAAIPYRYKISVNMQYAVSKSQPAPYFSDFSPVEVSTNV